MPPQPALNTCFTELKKKATVIKFCHWKRIQEKNNHGEKFVQKPQLLDS